MHKLVYIVLIGLLASCFGSPTEEPKDDIELLQLWSVDHGTAGDAPPIVHQDKIIMSGGLFVYALDKDTGGEIWKYQFEDDNILQGRIFLINGNQVAVAHTDKIRAWDISDGSLEWEFDYETNELRPRLAGDHISFADRYGYTSARNRFFTLDRSGEADIVKALDVRYSVLGLAYFNHKIYVSQSYTVTGLLTLGRITVLDAQTGDSLWAYNTDRSGMSAASIIENGILYAGTQGNSPENIFVALDAETGDTIWEYSNSEILTQDFIIGPNFIYANSGGTIFALNKNNGNLEWTFSWTSSTLVKPIYLEGYIYHSDHNRLFVIDAETGKLVHEEPLPDGGGFFWHVAASSDKVFAQTSNQLIAYQPWHLRDE